MPLKQRTTSDWLRSFSRPLWNGPPLSGKTTGLLSLPRRSLAAKFGREIDGAVHIVVVPGEFGASSILPEDDFVIHEWEFDSNLPTLAYRELCAELQARVLEILTGKQGPVSALVFDGLHKLYDLVMRVEGWTPALIDDKEGGKQYVRYHAVFGNFLARALGSPLPLVGATCYDGLEPVEPGSKMTQIFPLLPGKMAKEVMGLFPVVFHTGRDGPRYYWTLQAEGKMQAAGMHVPVRLLKHFPARIEVVWKDGELRGGWFEVERILREAGGTA